MAELESELPIAAPEVTGLGSCTNISNCIKHQDDTDWY